MKKIMFNDHYSLTRAVIDDTKRMTRRGCKDMATGGKILAADVVSWRFYPDENIVEFIMADGSVKVAVPPYKVGEVVAIAQSYKNAGYTKELVVKNIKPSTRSKPTDLFEKKYPGWNNKSFVKPNLMPLRIQFTDLKVERLHDISDEDCLKEGVKQWTWTDSSPCRSIEPREVFAALVDKVSGIGTWDSNPWVFAYSFELIRQKKL